MRLGPCLLIRSRKLQGAHPKLAYICSTPMAGFYAAVDTQTCAIAVLTQLPAADQIDETDHGRFARLEKLVSVDTLAQTLAGI